jgi:hypothetical protein
MLRGTTVEERLESAETAIRQIIRQVSPQRLVTDYANTGMGGHIPVLDDMENTVKLMIPTSGKMTNAFVFCESIPTKPGTNKKEATIRFEIEISPRLFESMSAVVPEGRSTAPGSKDIVCGTRMIISSDVPITGFWYSFEIEPITRTKLVDNPQLTAVIKEIKA